MSTAPAPGIYPNVRFEDYLKWPIMSQSTLKEGGEDGSMAALKAAIDGERRIVPTDDMLLGSALHVGFLEPEKLAEKVAVWTGDRRYGKTWDAFAAEHAHQTILTRERFNTMQGMVESMWAHPWVQSITPRVTGTEVAVVGDVHGVTMKARADALVPDEDLIVDVKKVRRGTARAVLNATLDYGYHWQAYVYTKLFGMSRFLLLTVESDPPYDVVPYELAPQFIRAGMREVIPVLDQLKFAQRTGKWPGRSDDIVMLDAPEFLIEDGDVAGITLNGSQLLEVASGE